MNYALIGCGRISPNHIAAARANRLNFVAMCDINSDNMLDKKVKFELSDSVKMYTDYKEMLQQEKIDLVAIATESGKHAEIAVDCIEAGCNVIIEKPITANSKELEDLIETANKKNLMIFEAMNLHYTPAFLSLKEDLKKLGDIKIVSFNYSQYSSRYNAFKEGTILPAFDYHKAGGALMDLNVYNIHALIDLFGKPVYHKYMANIERNIDTSGMMIFDFEHFKALCIGAKDCKAPLMNTIQGNLGAIVVKSPLSQMTEYEICYNDGTSEVKSFEKKHRLIYEFKEFMRMMEEKDVKKQKEMLDLSLLISKLMEEGRMQEGIVFDNDK